MDDYIERGKAAELLCKMICGNDRALCVSTYKNCRQKQMLELYEIPAANVREDVQGEWIFKQSYFGTDECNCSLCGQFLSTRIGERMPFCPHCGARMVGGGER